MNTDRFEGQWKQIQGKAKERWGRFTDNDLDTIAGKRDRLEGKIQEVYGKTRDEARKDVTSFMDSCECE